MSSSQASGPIEGTASGLAYSPKVLAAVFLAALTVPLAAAYVAISLQAASSVYRWFLVVHLGSIIGFMLVHGVPALVMFRLPKASGAAAKLYLGMARDRTLALTAGASLGLILSTGISLGLFAGYWTRGWLWATLVLAVFVTFAMSFLGRRHLDKAIESVEAGRPVEGGMPLLTAFLGLAVLLSILWLVLFKPF